MPYGLILPVAVGWLAVRHCRADAPSERSKLAVAVLTTGASVIMLTWPAVIPAALVLVGIGAYVIVHKDVTTTQRD
jgi:hypothetical protein